MNKLKSDNVALVEYVTKLELTIKKQDKKISEFDSTLDDFSSEIRKYKDLSEKSSRFTNREVAEVTSKYEAELSELKTSNATKEKKIQELEKSVRSLEKYKDYIVENDLENELNDKFNSHRHR